MHRAEASKVLSCTYLKSEPQKVLTREDSKQSLKCPSPTCKYPRSTFIKGICGKILHNSLKSFKGMPWPFSQFVIEKRNALCLHLVFHKTLRNISWRQMVKGLHRHYYLYETIFDHGSKIFLFGRWARIRPSGLVFSFWRGFSSNGVHYEVRTCKLNAELG